MVPRFAVLSAIALGVLSPTTSQAQVKRSQPAEPPPEASEPGGSGPQADVAPEKKTVTPAGGYAYSDKPTASAKAASHARYRSTGPVVNMPGFESTADGGSRLFVQLSQSVPVEERKAQGSLTYVLKGASPRVWNNTNALVTVHFNTPVARARLVPQGKDLLFVVELRSAATPTWKMNEATDKGALFTIDFPKGDYLQAAPVATDAPAPEPGAEEKPAPAPPRGVHGAKRRSGKKGAAPPKADHPANAPKP